MQIFVRDPSNNKTMLFDCTPNTTIREFQQWVHDRILWPPHAYYITRGGKYVPTQNPEATFAELNVQQENTFYLLGRLMNAPSKKI
jgi:hypothetical protein